MCPPDWIQSYEYFHFRCYEEIKSSEDAMCDPHGHMHSYGYVFLPVAPSGGDCVRESETKLEVIWGWRSNAMWIFSHLYLFVESTL